MALGILGSATAQPPAESSADSPTVAGTPSGESVPAAAADTSAEASDSADVSAAVDADEPREDGRWPSRRAPRAYGLTFGYSYSARNRLPLEPTGEHARPSGLAFEGRYGWQVGGLGGGNAAWIGFQTSFFAHVAGAERSSLGLDYGLFVKHAFGDGLRARPYFGYGLGACQVFVRGVAGRGIGHLTGLVFGVDFRLREGTHVALELSYRLVVIPTFESGTEPARRQDFDALRLSAGIFFGN